MSRTQMTIQQAFKTIADNSTLQPRLKADGMTLQGIEKHYEAIHANNPSDELEQAFALMQELFTTKYNKKENRRLLRALIETSFTAIESVKWDSQKQQDKAIIKAVIDSVCKNNPHVKNKTKTTSIIHGYVEQTESGFKPASNSKKSRPDRSAQQVKSKKTKKRTKQPSKQQVPSVKQVPGVISAVRDLCAFLLSPAQAQDELVVSQLVTLINSLNIKYNKAKTDDREQANAILTTFQKGRLAIIAAFSTDCMLEFITEELKVAAFTQEELEQIQIEIQQESSDATSQSRQSRGDMPSPRAIRSGGPQKPRTSSATSKPDGSDSSSRKTHLDPKQSRRQGHKRATSFDVTVKSAADENSLLQKIENYIEQRTKEKSNWLSHFTHFGKKAKLKQAEILKQAIKSGNVNELKANATLNDGRLSEIYEVAKNELAIN